MRFSGIPFARSKVETDSFLGRKPVQLLRHFGRHNASRQVEHIAIELKGARELLDQIRTRRNRTPLQVSR
jgi:hypothetical protein